MIEWRKMEDFEKFGKRGGRHLFIVDGRVVDGYENWGRIFEEVDGQTAPMCPMSYASYWAHIDLPEGVE